MNNDKKIQVCNNCLMASCWQGLYMCDDSRCAGTEYKTKVQLKKLGLEHPDYWKTDEELAGQK